MRRRTPRLDEAPGERSGSLPGTQPALSLVGLGESPMAAVGLAEQSEGVVPLLASRLSAASGRCVEWETAARSGANARFTAECLLPQLEARPVELAVIALGVNDCLALASPGQWRRDIEALCGGIRHRLEPQRIILAGIPPMQHFPALPAPLSWMLGLRSALLDAVCRRMAAEEDDLLHAPMDFVEDPEGLFCRDGFHPNARAHALWARQLAATVASA